MLAYINTEGKYEIEYFENKQLIHTTPLFRLPSGGPADQSSFPVLFTSCSRGPRQIPINNPLLRKQVSKSFLAARGLTGLDTFRILQVPDGSLQNFNGPPGIA